MAFSKRFVLRGLIGLGLFGACSGWARLGAQEPAPAEQGAAAQAQEPAAAVSAAKDPIGRALESVAEIDATDTPLSDLVNALEEEHGIEIQLDTRALEETGVTADVPVSFNVRGMTLGSALRHALRQHSLTWAIADGALVITTPQEAEQSYLDTRVYDVADLIAPRDGAPSALDNANSLLDVIAGAVAPDSWDEVGGPGALKVFEGALTVAQTEEVHEQLAALLAGLREARSQPGAAVIAPPEPSSQAQKVRQAIDEALARPIELDFADQPLTDVAALIAQQRGIPVLIDSRALEDAGTPPDVPVTLAIRGAPLEAALRHLLRPLKLTWMIQDEALVITTQEEAEQSGLRLRIYPLAEFAGPGGRTDPQRVDELIDTIQNTVAPDCWAEVGGPGTLIPEAASQVLVCSHTEQVQREVARLLADLRKARAAQPEVAEWAADDDQRMELQVYLLNLNQGDKSVADAELVAMMVQELVEPESWQSGNGEYVRALGDRLVVRQRRGVQREVQALLGQIGVLPISGTFCGRASAKEPGGMATGGGATTGEAKP
jgi:hypothetical protein